MLCQKCHKNLATVRYAEVVDGKVADINLCSECLSQHEDRSASGFELSGSIPAAKSGQRPQLLRPRPKAPRTCKSCRTKLSMVLDSGRIGCAHCYEHFSADIEPMLVALHGSVQHKGKTSRVGDVRARLRSGLQIKRSLLRSALETENYEEAASLRDDIRQLESVLGASLSPEE